MKVDDWTAVVLCGCVIGESSKCWELDECRYTSVRLYMQLIKEAAGPEEKKQAPPVTELLQIISLPNPLGYTADTVSDLARSSFLWMIHVISDPQLSSPPQDQVYQRESTVITYV